MWDLLATGPDEPGGLGPGIAGSQWDDQPVLDSSGGQTRRRRGQSSNWFADEITPPQEISGLLGAAGVDIRAPYALRVECSNKKIRNVRRISRNASARGFTIWT